MIKTFINKISKDYEKQVLSKLDISEINFIPVSALEGDNITKNSLNMPWYKGKPLMSLLEDAIVENFSIQFSLFQCNM